ncbi:MAG: hypothetical protein K9J81_05945 [Desulfohalobiaceae bacterium]|nr:hypothetical protein [Desulfohalobiaceae bacterium]
MSNHKEKTTLEEKFGLEEKCEKALSSKNNYPFMDLCELAESAGFQPQESRKKKGGSHVKMYKHPSYVLWKNNYFNDLMNFQPDHKKSSKAKPAQIAQLVEFIREAVSKEKE